MGAQEIYNRFKSTEADKNKGISELRAAQEEISQARAAVAVAESRVSYAEQMIRQASRVDDEDGSELEYAQSVYQSAKSNLNEAQSQQSAAESRYSAAKNKLHRCLSEFENFEKLVLDARKKAKAQLDYAISLQASNRYMNNDVTINRENQIEILDSWESDIRRDIEEINSVLTDSDPQRQRSLYGSDRER